MSRETQFELHRSMVRETLDAAPDMGVNPRVIASGPSSGNTYEELLLTASGNLFIRRYWHASRFYGQAGQMRFSVKVAP